MCKSLLFGAIFSVLFAQQGAEYLIITYDGFESAVSQLADWKNERGIMTHMVKLTEINPNGAPTKEEIKAYIETAYNTWNPCPKYVLLVGDDEKIPTFYFSNPQGHPTDNPYADMTGDFRAELAIGRFAVGDIDKCQTMTAKVIGYENNPYSQSPIWSQKATLILNEDQENNEPYWYTINYAYNQLVGHCFTADKFVDTWGDDRDDVINAINDGRVLVAYRGEANPGAWDSPFDFSPNALTNGWKLPIVITGGCYTGNYTSPYVMCNTWTQAGDAQNPNGAVAFLGTSTIDGLAISWSRGYTVKGFFKAIFEENKYTLGDAFVSAKDYMADNHLNLEDPLNPYTEWVQQEYEAWTLIGDPTLQIPGLITDDPLALAYNGNRHLVRKPNTQELHLVYANLGEVVYRYSSNGGANWTLPCFIGNGKLPAIALGSDYISSISWVDDFGQLWSRKQVDLQGNWSDSYLLYSPAGAEASSISPPSIVITSHPLAVDTVHILFSASILYQISPNGNNTWLLEYSFPINDPTQLTMKILYLDTEYRPEPPFPSITRDLNQTLHAVWNWADTICYAIREVEQEWSNWGPQFDDASLQSAHPFVETYGDSVFVVWQHIEPTTLKEEIYRVGRQIPYPFEWWDNLSQTLNKVSLHAVNASGLATTFADEPELIPPNTFYEIYWKTRPEDPLHNISQSPMIKSIFPQTAMRFNQIADNELYVVWQEGNEAPYEIKFKREWVPGFIPAFLTSIGGDSVQSSYLVERDTFFSDWAIPVDAGFETITYQIPLEPGYRYKIKVVAYHESSGEWREWVNIDGREKHLIKYCAYEPETLEFWVPPAFYQDGVVDLVFERIKGGFAAAGPWFVYRLEYEEEKTVEEISSSGPMTNETHSFGRNSCVITPNPFTNELSIKAHMAEGGQRISYQVYDITGRLVKRLYEGIIANNQSIHWVGNDENNRKVPPGIYFLEFTATDTKENICHKIIKVE